MFHIRINSQIFISGKDKVVQYLMKYASLRHSLLETPKERSKVQSHMFLHLCRGVIAIMINVQKSKRTRSKGSFMMSYFAISEKNEIQ